MKLKVLIPCLLAMAILSYAQRRPLGRNSDVDYILDGTNEIIKTNYSFIWVSGITLYTNFAADPHNAFYVKEYLGYIPKQIPQALKNTMRFRLSNQTHIEPNGDWGGTVIKNNAEIKRDADGTSLIYQGNKYALWVYVQRVGLEQYFLWHCKENNTFLTSDYIYKQALKDSEGYLSFFAKTINESSQKIASDFAIPEAEWAEMERQEQEKEKAVIKKRFDEIRDSLNKNGRT